MNPGWYSDPHGGPDLRWWDGSTWTEHTAPRPGATPGAESGPWGAAPGPDAAPPGAPPGPHVPAGPGAPSGGTNRGLLIGLGVLVAVALAVGAFVVLSGDDEAATDPTTTTTTGDERTTTIDDGTTTTTEGSDPDSERVSAGGLSYERLDAPWEPWDDEGSAFTELQDVDGQFVVVQQDTPLGGDWISNLLIGELAPSFDYGGPDDLADVTRGLAGSLIANHYLDGATTSRLVKETELTLDGHPAYFMHHELTFSLEGLDADREKLIVVVVDTGGERPGVFWASIPYNRIDLNDSMDAAYASLRVED